MSNDKSRDALSDAPIPQRNNSAEVVQSSSPLDYVLWGIALILLIASMMVNQHLPAYWAPANDIWVRVGVILTCIVVALGYYTPPIKAKALFVCLKIHVLSYVESLGLLNRKL